MFQSTPALSCRCSFCCLWQSRCLSQGTALRRHLRGSGGAALVFWDYVRWSSSQRKRPSLTKGGQTSTAATMSASLGLVELQLSDTMFAAMNLGKHMFLTGPPRALRVKKQVYSRQVTRSTKGSKASCLSSVQEGRLRSESQTKNPTCYALDEMNCGTCVAGILWITWSTLSTQNIDTRFPDLQE